VDDDALDVLPLLDKPQDVAGVLRGKEDILCRRVGYDVVEREP